MKQNVSRRGFLGAGAAAGLFNLVPASVFGANAPSNRVTMAVVGCGGQAGWNMRVFLDMADVRVTDVCDVNTAKTDSFKRRVDGKYRSKDCRVWRDFRDVCSRPDVDTVLICTPDHWHACVGTFAAAHGKDIYGEKPFTHDLLEGRALVEALARSGRIWQTGSWQRSGGEFRHAVELVRNGHLGKIARVEVGLPSGGRGPKSNPNAQVPKTLDWNMYLGPAPYRPFEGVYDAHWRWVSDWGGGQLMDWVGHHGDIAQWGLKCDQSGPVSFQGFGEGKPDGVYDTPTEYRVDCEYANGIKMVVASGKYVQGGAKWIGENGEWVWVNRGRWDASPAIKNSRIEAGEERVKSVGHWRQFIESVKTRTVTISPAEVAHRSASVGHLCLIAMKTGRKITWDPATETIANDAEATKLLGRNPRGPWALY